MANPEHLQILQQSVKAWNAWRDQNGDIRPDLAGANLRRADLIGANLGGANLRGTNLIRVTLGGADLHWANLIRANLGGANLIRANLGGANLRGTNLIRVTLGAANLIRVTLGAANLIRVTLGAANLHEANLIKANLGWATLGAANLHEANLIKANLTGANLSHVALFETVFSDTNLTDVRGLETCDHGGPSILDHHTLAKSGPLPLPFLRGCGLNDWEIEAAKLYHPGLTPTQITDIVYRIYSLRADPLIQFYSCFISYASKDHAFAERLYADLQNKGVRCWFAPEDMKIGARIRDTIDQQIRLREKLLVVLSSASITSSWVEDEVEAALEEERASPERRTVLVPIKIDSAVEDANRAWARTIKRTRHIGDFTHWEDNDAYQEALVRLLRDLNTAERQS